MSALAPHQQRVVDEKRDLDVKSSLLHAFLSDSAKSAVLSCEERHRMQLQFSAMALYSHILGERIAAF